MGQKERYSEESYKKIEASKYKYRKANYIQKNIRIKKEQKEQFKQAAEAAGMSLNSWMIEACRRYAGCKE